MPAPSPIGRSRNWYVARASLVALTVLALVLGAGLLAKARAESAAAAAAADGYSAPAFSAPVRVQRVVSIIGDALIAPTGSTSWVDTAAQSLKVTAYSQEVRGGGYVKVSQGDAISFVNESSLVAPGARSVVFFGGIADRGADRFLLAQQVTVALAEAKRIAPNARILLVGPPYEGPAPDDVLSVRNALRTAASIASVEFVDPISSGWTPAGSDYLNASSTAWTRSGQRMVATRMDRLLAPLVDGS